MKWKLVFCIISFLSLYSFIFANKLVDVASGKNHSLLLFEDGSILPFGENTYGQLGLPKTIEHQSISEEKPLYIEISIKFISVAVGLDFSLAVAEDSSLWGWGKIGKENLEEPHLLSNSTDWKKVFAKEENLSKGKYFISFED